MSNIPAELKYVDSHEWLRLEADGSVTVGITEHAQQLLGDIVFVELPKVGAVLARDEQAGVVESVKAASDVYCPIAGEVLAVNEELEGEPELANTDPYGDGWFFRIKPAKAADLDGLMDAAAYAKEIGA
ncbi:glycine cleavage system protein H [Chromobacterium sp. ATCC 53434]|uniref:glycine cleavage system protein GcvH n=1 Tax=Chromobacterium sp. (strain ATCC 53434 / SC 14030) TaxID=2059672 RepID=UPI000C78B09B|nr:glycine cleavage system protein GcvH [Chromobacterium sp. ATCC 53434]AUH50115.1 glycine cleavage system protein H [Chromobacterium sp. ATCC 53434]